MGDDLKLELVEIDLVSISAYRTAEEWDEEGKTELARQTNISVLEIRENLARVRLGEKVFFKPSGPFRIELELEGKFRVEGTPEREKVEARVEGAMYPLFAQASLIVSFISDRILGAPVIIPPYREES